MLPSELMLARARSVLIRPVRGQTPDMSVTDTDEVQAPRRRRRPCLRAVAPVEQACQLLGRALEHRPDQRAGHMAEEAVGGQLELERVAAPVPDRTLDSAREAPMLRLSRREGP